MAFSGLDDLLIPESGVEGYFVIGLADVLGQSDALIAAPPAPGGLRDRDKLAALRSQTLGPVRQFRKDFHDQFRAFENETGASPLNLLKGPVGDFLNSLDSEPIGIHAFSDLVALSLSLATDKKSVPMFGVFLLTASFGMASLCALYRGHSVRGGIELDIGWPLGEKEIYGPALAKAHHLESKVADYQRIVVGRNLLDYLSLSAKLPDSDPNGPLASRVQSLLVIDGDGQTVVNPFSEFYWPPGSESRRGVMHERCLQFAQSERARFSGVGDSRMVGRYQRLVAFLEKYGPTGAGS